MANSETKFRAQAATLFMERMKHGDKLSVAVCVFVVVAGVFPTAFYTGLGSFHRVAADPLWVLISATLASLGFCCLYYTDRCYWYYGILAGIITGPTMVFGTVLCVCWRTECTVYTDFEVLLPLAIACVPAWLLWYLPLRQRVIHDLEETFWRERTSSVSRAGVAASSVP